MSKWISNTMIQNNEEKNAMIQMKNCSNIVMSLKYGGLEITVIFFYSWIVGCSWRDLTIFFRHPHFNKKPYKFLLINKPL
jgi:hypothetical protein